jgi:hypothetical protein
MGQENNLPNVDELTAPGDPGGFGASASSWPFIPDRELSLRHVSTPGKLVTSTVAELNKPEFDFRIAVT